MYIKFRESINDAAERARGLDYWRKQCPGIPLLAAYTATPKMLKKWPDLRANFLVPCPYCGTVHKHGCAEGDRVAHCHPKPPDLDNGYCLVHAGELPQHLERAYPWGRVIVEPLDRQGVDALTIEQVLNRLALSGKHPGAWVTPKA